MQGTNGFSDRGDCASLSKSGSRTAMNSRNARTSLPSLECGDIPADEPASIHRPTTRTQGLSHRPFLRIPTGVHISIIALVPFGEGFLRPDHHRRQSREYAPPIVWRMRRWEKSPGSLCRLTDITALRVQGWDESCPPRTAIAPLPYAGAAGRASRKDAGRCRFLKGEGVLSPVRSRIGACCDLCGFLPNLPSLGSVQTGCPSATVVLDRTPPGFGPSSPLAESMSALAQTGQI